MLLRYVTLALVAVIAGAAAVVQAPPSTLPLLVDGHVHITDRVYWEHIDPWTPQPVGPWDFARAHDSGVNVIIENVAPYGYQTYNTTVKQTGRLIETFHRLLDANRNRMELALSASDVRRIVANGKFAVILGVEAGFDQDGDVDILRLWYRLGVRLIQFSSQVTTAYADAGRGGARWQGINDRGRLLIAEMNRLGIIIDITHATEAAQRQIIQASRAPVVASHVAMRALCNNPGNLSDDVLGALAMKGGLVGIHGGAANISQRYFDWSRSHPPVSMNSLTLQDVVQAELPLVRSPTQDYGTYIEALDARMGGLWRQFHAQPWKDAADAELLVPTVDEFAEHVAHAVSIAGPTHVGIGLDLVHGRSYLKNFDARAYPRLVDALKKRKIPSEVLGENWLSMLDAAKVQ